MKRLRSLIPRFGAKSASPKLSVEALEMKTYDGFLPRSYALNKISYHRNHYLYGVSNLIKSEGVRVSPSSSSPNACREIESISAILKHDVANLLKEIAAIDEEEAISKFGSTHDQKRIASETLFRVSYFSNYLETLRSALQNDQIPRAAVNYEKLVDAFLLGTASERIAEHIAMYGKILDQYQLQASFYALYEPEVQTCVELLKRDSVLTKKVLKDLPKYASTYLLDNLVLNTKSRSIFCWSVPEYSGFTPVDDHVLVDTEVLLKSRREYFEEGDEIGNLFLSNYKERREAYYTERNSIRKTLYQGVGFFFVVSFLDMYITSM